jgi:hypothetical protein
MAIQALRTTAPGTRESGTDSEIRNDEEENMNSSRWNRLPVGIAVALVLLASVSSAQQGAKAKGGRAYDANNVETITGEVVGLEKIPSPGGKGYGVHLSVKTEKETLAVEVGPGWYVEKQPVKIEVKDILEIRGSRVASHGKPAIVAAEIRKGDQILKLRDENGIPAWSGGGRLQAN